MEKRLDVRRANRILVMLYNEWKVLANDDRPLKIEWNMMHMYSSCQLAKLYALKNNLDVELSAIIAILHDIAVVEGKFRVDHDKLAPKYVKGAIQRYNTDYKGKLNVISNQEEEIIIGAISVHSQKEDYTDNPYVEMLKDVDSLDRFLHGIKTDGAYLERTDSFLKQINIEVNGESNE